MQDADARQHLESERERVTRLVRDLREGNLHPGETENDEVSELADYDQHPADHGTETFEREKDLSILESLEGELADLETALRRLDEGSYGRCEECGQPIPDERLEARPTARFCVEHEPVR